MDNLDLYADEELYEDEEEEAVEEEGSNRTFIILVAALGGLLAVTVCIFVVWALVISPRMGTERLAENQAIQETNEAVLAAAGMLTETVPLEDTATPVPADVSDEPTKTAKPPTATPRPATGTPAPETPTAAPEGEAAEATPAEVADAATATPRRPTATPRVTPTPRAGKSGVPETGIGTLAASALAVGLLFLLLTVRRMRRAV